MPNKVTDGPAQSILLRRRELAQLACVSMPTLERMAASGALAPKPVRMGGCLRYYRDEVRAWLHCRRHDGSLHDAKSWPAVWKEVGMGG